MRARRAYLLVLILSFLFADVSASFLFRPASLKVLSKIPSWLKKLRTEKPSWIVKAWENLNSYLHSHGGRLHIGDFVEGLSKIQDYFELFGYLNSTLQSNFSGKFSPELESAIEHFQKIFNLTVNGQLNDDTVSLIKRPRCGLPDIIDGSTIINSAKENRTTSFKKWWPQGKTELTYAFSTDIETTSFRDVFADAFRRWSQVTMLKFRETTSFNESDIRITFLSLDGKLGMVGGAGTNDTARRGDVVLDSDEEWVLPSENKTGDRLDLESAVMHQIGHVLGLKHSSIEEAIMYPFVVPWKKTKVDFAEDDLERIQQLYGPRSNYGELSPAPSPGSEGGIGGRVTGGTDGGVASVGPPRWGVVFAFWLGIIWLFCF